MRSIYGHVFLTHISKRVNVIPIAPGISNPDALFDYKLAAIAVAGLGLYYSGGHEMRDVAWRGSGADYLVDESDDLLEEVAGRSRRRDVEVSWQQRWQRLTDRMGNGFYVCVAKYLNPIADANSCEDG